jgi:hypothetical protein
MTERPKRSLEGAVVLAVLLAILAGCSTAGSEPKAELLETGVPLGEPSWSPDDEALLAVDEDGRRVVRVDVGEAEGPEVPVGTREIGDLGVNVVADPEAPGRAYVGRPGADEISALDTRDLRVVGGHEAGGSPYHVTLDAQAEVIFALSEDGATVSSAELGDHEKIPAVSIGAGKEALIEAPEKGLEPAFWVANAAGVSYYYGNPPRRLVGKEIPATDIAADKSSAQRIYVADGERIVALEGDPQEYLEGRLVDVAERDVGAPVERVASDELEVYAATEDRLVVMRRETLETVESVDFGRLLEKEDVRPKGISGIAVGSDDVYVAFEGAPYVLKVKKP